jgi:triphosphoribosyl-dephospho-CoA synthase CitG
LTLQKKKLKLSDIVSSAAVWAILSEAAVTPKPGLVDRNNSGSHVDMDYFSLLNSAVTLFPWFRECTLAGFNSKDINPVSLFESLRPKGIKAEALMNKATGGVNTHRGYIFSLGILCTAFGRIRQHEKNPELKDIIEFSKAMTINLENDFYQNMDIKSKVSHGEVIFSKNGITGIRGEVSRGFPSVIKTLPVLNKMLQQGNSFNDAGVAALLYLISQADDTNMIFRSGLDTFRSIQHYLCSFLAAEPNMETIKKKALELDREFIEKNFSPGGSADLLGITFFLWRILKAA